MSAQVSTHPALLSKLSQLRSANATPREAQALIHEISLLLASEALKDVLTVKTDGVDVTPLGLEYGVVKAGPEKIVMVPILRSGLGMVRAFETLLPFPVPIHHLGLFREKTTLQPVEYYNNLPPSGTPPPSLAIILDPVIATGGTMEAAIQTLRDWGVLKIAVVSVIASKVGIERVVQELGKEGEGVVYVGAVDEELGSSGMILPGVGDVGDRLFLTIGK